jgi:hypothetical protein
MPKGLGYAFAISFLSPTPAPELIALCAPIVSTLGAAPLGPEGSAPKFSITVLIKVGTGASDEASKSDYDPRMMQSTYQPSSNNTIIPPDTAMPLDVHLRTLQGCLAPNTAAMPDLQ